MISFLTITSGIIIFHLYQALLFNVRINEVISF
jgi:hypothetical protein